MKVAINTEIGGFRLSHKGIMRYAELTGIKLYPYRQIYWSKAEGEKDKFIPISDEDISKYGWEAWYFTEPIHESKKEWYEVMYYLPFDMMQDGSAGRADPILIQVIEELGSEASLRRGSIKIVEIPDNVKFYIDSSDEGYESIHEEHRIWS